MQCEMTNSISQIHQEPFLKSILRFRSVAVSLKFSESASRNWKHFCDIFTSAARSIRFTTEISATDDLFTPRSKSMPSYLGPNPSADGCNQCLLWWSQIYALPDCAQCVPSWKNLSTTWHEPVPPLMGQAPFSSWLRSVPPLQGLNPSLYKTSISLKVKIVFVVVDSGFMAVPCPFVSGNLVSSIFPLISACD